jgi:hypothetical protein
LTRDADTAIASRATRYSISTKKHGSDILARELKVSKHEVKNLSLLGASVS